MTGYVLASFKLSPTGYIVWIYSVFFWPEGKTCLNIKLLLLLFLDKTSSIFNAGIFWLEVFLLG